MLAIKLYSVAINSMADERTASNFTWFNSAVRNRQEVKTLVDMIQVRQWYLNQGSDKPKTHPTVRWADLDKIINGRTTAAESKDSKDTEISEDEDEDEDDEEIDIEPQREFVTEGEVDLLSESLLNMLIDEPVDAPQSTAAVDTSVAEPVTSAVDWNF
ncbi:hypothetical protein B0H21DRAFT_767143 [Amylocystis lapponica]|nr:hypothetical protein B0H21DRAFT_767143 [Amylocystis lapponica]